MWELTIIYWVNEILSTVNMKKLVRFLTLKYRFIYRSLVHVEKYQYFWRRRGFFRANVFLVKRLLTNLTLLPIGKSKMMKFKLGTLSVQAASIWMQIPIFVTIVSKITNFSGIAVDSKNLFLLENMKSKNFCFFLKCQK